MVFIGHADVWRADTHQVDDSAIPSVTIGRLMCFKELGGMRQHSRQVFMTPPFPLDTERRWLLG